MLAIVAISLQSVAQVGATYINRVYQDAFGQPVYNPILNPFGAQWSKSIVNSLGQHISVAHTYVSGEGENITLRKTDATGTIIFQLDTNTTGTNNDYGIGVFEDLSHNIYVCGVTDNGGGSAAYSAIIIKYDQFGAVLASTSIGSSGLNYIATALTVHPMSGNLLVALCAENATTGYDYKVYKLNSSTLGPISSNTYDYASLTEVPLGIEVIPGTGNIMVVGGSQSSTTGWAYAKVIFNNSTLAVASSTRTNLGGLGYDEPAAYKLDANGTVYITGRSYDLSSSKYVIKTVKIDSANTIVWTNTLSLHGQDNAAGTIDTDPITGEVLIGGYATKSSMIKEMYCARLNASTGTVVKTHTQNSEDYSADGIIKKLGTNAHGDVYFIAGETGKSGKKQVVVGKIRANGKQSWQRKISDPLKDLIPSDIQVTSSGIFVISVVTGTSSTYLETNYTEFEMDTSRAFGSGGKAKYMKNQLIVQFKGEVVDSAVIDNKIGTKITQYGALSSFLTTGANSQLSSALARECPAYSNIKAVKVFPYIPTTLTTITSRLGQTTPFDNFWTTLLLEFPSGSNLVQIDKILNENKSVVTYAHPNYLGEMFNGPPSDPSYSLQISLSSPTAGINVETAWDKVRGRAFVRVGVFDTGIHYVHEDFDRGFGSGLVTSIIDGWDFHNNNHPKDNTEADVGQHGTGVAGIIGANLDNQIGIAGVAGGVNMYDLNILFQLGTDPNNSAATVADAIITSCLSSTDSPAPYAFDVNLMNHSWGILNDVTPTLFTDSNITVLNRVIHQANRVGVTMVAARGNSGFNNKVYPANSDDDWVITVGGTGVDGAYASTAVAGNMTLSPSYGGKIDLAAPFVYSTMWTTYPSPSTLTINNYSTFGGTSGAAPHVTGVAALLMSYLNDSLPDPKNLAPEDCEYILQKSATDVNSTGYDSLTGYGRLNAGSAIAMVEKPYYSLKHFGTLNSPNTLHVSLFSSNDTIKVLESYTNYSNPRVSFDRGKYILKTFQVTTSISHSLNLTDTVKHSWPRPSTSYVLELFDPVKKTLWPRERPILNSCTSSGASLTGYVYQVFDTTGTFKGWWPCDTTFTSVNIRSLFEYSLISRNLTVGIKEERENRLSVDIFPNPASINQTLVIKTKEPENLSIDLYDMMGRKLKTVYKGKTTIGEMRVVHELDNLPKSMYIYLIKIGNNSMSKKFIKE